MIVENPTEFQYFEQLFGSKTRVKLLRLFLLPTEPKTYYIREICRLISEHLNSVRRELENLEKLGLIVKTAGEAGAEAGVQKIFYKGNQNFLLYNELRALFIKSQLLLEKSLMEKITALGPIQLLILTGVFTSNNEAVTDLLVVGRVKTNNLSRLVKQFEQELGRDIKYTLMSSSEFTYRRDLTDLFLYNILENQKVVLIDNIGLNRPDSKNDSKAKKISIRQI